MIEMLRADPNPLIHYAHLVAAALLDQAHHHASAVRRILYGVI
jgi:hypothetical protein